MAQVTYYYQGNNYDNFVAPYTANSRITGSFQLPSALDPGTTTDLTNTLQVFSFSDGQATRDESNTVLCEFSVTTNSIGVITDWSIYMRQNNTGPTENQHAIDIFTNTEQSGFDPNLGNTGCGSIALDPFGASNAPPSNAWSGGPARPVPSLSMMMLIVLAMLLAGSGLYIKRKENIDL
jgi:hypothetical protein